MEIPADADADDADADDVDRSVRRPGEQFGDRLGPEDAPITIDLFNDVLRWSVDELRELVDDALDYGGSKARLGKNVGDDFREGKITLPVILAFRRGNAEEREFWRRSLETGAASDAALGEALGILKKHGAIDDTVERARHYGAIAKDALALFPDGDSKRALLQVVDFCVARAH